MAGDDRELEGAGAGGPDCRVKADVFVELEVVPDLSGGCASTTGTAGTEGAETVDDTIPCIVVRNRMSVSAGDRSRPGIAAVNVLV